MVHSSPFVQETVTFNLHMMMMIHDQITQPTQFTLTISYYMLNIRRTEHVICLFFLISLLHASN